MGSGFGCSFFFICGFAMTGHSADNSVVLNPGGDEKMSVVRVHKTKNFTVMSNYHFKEKEMSLKAKGLLSLMLSLPDSWNYSVSGLVKLSKDGKDGVMSALSELEKFGYFLLFSDRYLDQLRHFWDLHKVIKMQESV